MEIRSILQNTSIQTHQQGPFHIQSLIRNFGFLYRLYMHLYDVYLPPMYHMSTIPPNTLTIRMWNDWRPPHTYSHTIPDQSFLLRFDCCRCCCSVPRKWLFNKLVSHKCNLLPLIGMLRRRFLSVIHTHGVSISMNWSGAFLSTLPAMTSYDSFSRYLLCFAHTHSS